MAGLQLISPMVSSLWVSSRVRAPKRAEAAAASHPACPPPITITSQDWVMARHIGEGRLRVDAWFDARYALLTMTMLSSSS